MARAGVLVCMLALPVCTLVRAEIVRDLYSAEVPVADQSEQALAAAAGEALAEVLVKVSGSEEVLRDAPIRAALGKARDHVQQYVYRRRAGPGGALGAHFEFDEGFVTGLVTEAGAPLWTANRPRVLVWLVLEDSDGRNFVTGESEPDLTRSLLAEFSRRGVPAQLPLFDLSDASALSPEQAWRLHAPSLRGASLRYDVQDVLAGRMAPLSAGEWVGEWSYLHGSERLDRSLTAPTPEAFMRQGAALVAENMASRYAVLPSRGDGGTVLMSVSGVYSYADYAAIVAWLEGLELVDSADVRRIERDTIELSLRAHTDAASLATMIALNERLQPLPDPYGGTPRSSSLSYQWRN
jgi:hypothetical protein